MISDKIEKQLEELKEEMESETKGETTMTEKKPAAKKKVAAKKTAPKKAAPKKSTEGLVSLADLAKEAKIKPNMARRKLRAAGIANEGRWKWEENSASLKKAREALGL